MAARSRWTCPYPRLSLIELVGMVAVYAAYNAVFATVSDRMRGIAAPGEISRWALEITVAVNLVISVPMALALLVRWVGDWGRREDAVTPYPAPERDELVGLTETVLLGVITGAALLRLILGPKGRGGEAWSVMATAVGIPVLFAVLVGLGLVFLHLTVRQFSRESRRAGSGPPDRSPGGS